MTPGELGACFDRFTRSAFRLETLQDYAGEEDRVEAFRLGLPLPVRSVRTSPWLARIAVTTVAGKRWQRVRAVEEPLTTYTRYEMTSYVESQAAGEEIRILRRSAVTAPLTLARDFWLFDAETPQAYALLMDYGSGGQFEDARLITGTLLDELTTRRGLVMGWSVPLNAYLAGKAARAA